MNADLATVAALLRERKLRIDPRLRGECARWFENAGIRRHYYSPAGMTIDQAGEAIAELSGQYGSDRMSEREVCDLLERIFVDRATARKRNTDASRSIEAAQAHAVAVRRTTRLRLWECAACRLKLRGASDTLTVEHVHVDPDTLAEARYPFVLVTPILNPSTPF